MFGAALFLLLIFGGSLCSLLIDYKWWGEMGQVDTWMRMWLYRYVPDFLQWLILVLVLWVAHSRGISHAEAGGLAARPLQPDRDRGDSGGFSGSGRRRHRWLGRREIFRRARD